MWLRKCAIALLILSWVSPASAGHEKFDYSTVVAALGWAPFMVGTAATAAACPTNGPTSPGLVCDALGWTVLNPVGATACEGQSGSTPPCTPASTDTRIIYTSGGATACGGSPCVDNTTCGTFTTPCLTQRYAATTIMRVGSPDWTLAKCGDVNPPGGNIGNISRGAGAGLTGPWVFGNYDGNNHVAIASLPADSPNCSARPVWKIDQATSKGSVFIPFGAFNYWAVVGQDYWCYTRDPNGSFLLADAQWIALGIGMLGVTDGYLWEDNAVHFCGDNGLNGPGPYVKTADVFIRRSQFYNGYGENASIPNMGLGISGQTAVNLYGNVIDHNSWEDGDGIQSSLNWALQTNGFQHNIYTQDFGINGVDPATIQAKFNIIDNLIAEDNVGGEQFRVAANNLQYNAFIKEPVGGVGSNEISGSTPNWSHNIWVDTSTPLEFIGGTTANCGSTIQNGDTVTGGTSGQVGTVFGGVSCSSGNISFSVYITNTLATRTKLFLAGETVTSSNGSMTVNGSGAVPNYATEALQVASRGADGVIKSYRNAPWTMNDNYFVANYADMNSGGEAMLIGSTGLTQSGGATNISGTGNVIFGYIPTTTATGGIVNPQGGIDGTPTITSGGSGYTDQKVTFATTCSSSASTNTALAPTFTGSLATSGITFSGAGDGWTATGTRSTAFQITFTGLSAGGIITAGSAISGTGIPGGTTITGQISGTAGSNGTYSTSVDTTASGASITGTGNMITVGGASGYIAISGGTGGVSVLTGTGVPSSTQINAQAGFTATGTRTALDQITFSNVGGIVIYNGATISGAGIPGGTTITGQISGTPGLNGVYSTSVDTTASGAAVTGVSGTPNGNGIYQLNQNASWSSTTVTDSYQVFTLATTVSGAFTLGPRIYAVTPTAVPYGNYSVQALITGTQGANGSTYFIINGGGQPILTVSPAETFYEGCGNDDGQNYIAVQVPPNTFQFNVGIGTEGNCFYQMSSGSDLTLHGPINCEVSFNGSGAYYATQINLFPSTWNGSTTGTLYWPYYQTQLSNFSTGSAHCTGTYPQLDLTSVGGTIVGATYGGQDYTNTGFIPGPGVGCQVNDTLTAATGSACANPNVCGSGLPSGSGLKITLNTVSSTNIPQNNTCIFATDNITDVTGSNACSFSDPYRSAGSWAAFNASAWGISANATCTSSSITASVLTLGGCSGGAVGVNDAVVWAGQSNAVIIAADKTHQPSLCGTACTGNGGNGTYLVKGVTSQASISMTLWNSQQYIDRAKKQFKGNFLTSLTPCKFLTYIKQGFGQTETCSF